MSKKSNIVKNILLHFIPIGKIVLEKRGKCCLSFVPTCDKDVLYNENGRVYVIVAIKNYIPTILKFGQSSSKKGMCSTMSFYVNAPSHDPGMNRYSMHYVMRDFLKEGCKIMVYAAFGKPIKSIRTGYNGEKYTVISSPNPKDDESYWLNKYIDIFGEYPICNYQERGDKSLPYMKEYGEYTSKRRTRKKK